MAQINPSAIRLGNRTSTLKRDGFAVEYFPRYVNRQVRLHSLDVVLLSVIVHGKGQHILGDEVHRETGGSIAVTHYGQEHDIITDARGMEIYNVYLDLQNHPLPILPESLRPTLSTILPVHPRLQHHLNRRVWMRLEQPRQLAASLARMEAEARSTSPGALEIVRHSLQIFLIDVCRAAQLHGFVPSHMHDTPFPVWVERLRQKIDAEFAEPHDLQTLAKYCGVSVPYLCRLFKDYTNKTVVEYLVERRIEAALWKLRESDEKIIGIALACGFNDLAYFNRTFKRIVRMTPSAYRDKMRG